MNKIIYKQETEVKIGDIIDYYDMNIILTQELIDNNPDLFEVKEDVPEYVEWIGAANDFTFGNIYKFPKPIDDTGYERKCITNWTNWSLKFKPSTKEAYRKQELLKEAKKRFPVGSKFKGIGDFGISIKTVNKLRWNYSYGIACSIGSLWEYVYSDETNTWAEKIEKLFVTEDGVDIYEGDGLWYISTGETKDIYWTPFKYEWDEDKISLSENYKWFSSKSKAQEYVDTHRRKILEDYENILLKNVDIIKFWKIDESSQVSLTYGAYYDLLKQNEPRLYWIKVLQLIASELNNGWVQDSNEWCSIIMRDGSISQITQPSINDIIFKNEALAEKAIDIITKENLNKIK